MLVQPADRCIDKQKKYIHKTTREGEEEENGVGCDLQRASAIEKLPPQVSHIFFLSRSKSLTRKNKQERTWTLKHRNRKVRAVEAINSNVNNGFVRGIGEVLSDVRTCVGDTIISIVTRVFIGRGCVQLVIIVARIRPHRVEIGIAGGWSHRNSKRNVM